ncbi:MAG TPA: prolyl oligopeptidase family serine peptidase [Candidatus Acidoferrales bacterium]|nr:prolyl oligopeptidase family serine peptidase [Candidatus Acidoferrales bacterium]
MFARFWHRRSINHRTPRSGLLAAIFAAVVMAAPARSQSAAPNAPPKTRADNFKEVLHGVELEDPYRWLEDQQSPETRGWIDAQNAYTDALLGKLPGREGLKRRLTALLEVDSIEPPIERNGRYFFRKRLASQDQFVLYMRKGLHGSDAVLIDPHPMSPDHTTNVNFASISKDATLLVYTIRQGGEDETSPRLFDVDARKDLPDRLPKARYARISLTPDKTGIYYSRLTPEGPRVYLHKVGSDAAGDLEIFGKGYGPEKIIVSWLSDDGRYLVIHVLHGSAADRTEVYLQDVAKQGPIVPLVNDIPARFFAYVAGDTVFLHTNWNAPKGRILSTGVQDLAREHWREVVPQSDAVIEDVAPVGGRLAVLLTQNASSRLKLYEPGGKLIRELELPAIGSVSSLGGRWTSKELFFTFESFHIPETIYRYDLAKHAQEVWARRAVPIESGKYDLKQAWYASKDGTKIPMFLVYPKGIKLDGTNPTLLGGYGGFNVSETPAFTPRAAAWISSGGVFAYANLRGGGEFGEEWHRAGMLGKKQNVFDDFIAAAEWLIQNKYTRPSRLAIRGNSNGGLLVGAALTERPDLFGAVVCGFPLLDMVRYHKFLVAKYWVPEYGSSDDPEQFKYILAYSPYHHVTPGTKYPPTLLISGDSDTRVAPLHARKMAARLQAAQAASSLPRPVLLHYDTKAGHSAGVPISKQVDDLTDEFAFLFWQLGVSPAPPTK